MTSPGDRFLNGIGHLANCGVTPNEAASSSKAFMKSFIDAQVVESNINSVKSNMNSLLDLASISIFLPMIIFYIIVIFTLGLSGVISALDTLMLIIIGIVFVYIFSLIYRLGIANSLVVQGKRTGDLIAANINRAVDNAVTAYVDASKQATQVCP